MISIVIPNYNGRHLLEKYLPSVILAAQNSGFPFEIIIPDDASTDDSCQFIQKNYPSIFLVVNQVNGGFSKNMNSGIAQANYDWVMALNNDVALEPDYFTHFKKYLADENCFGVMGGIYDQLTNKLADAAKYPKRTGYAEYSGSCNYNVRHANPNILLPTFFLSGANALMNRKKLNTLGGYDELYSPFYYEDVDLGIKAWRMGWTCYYEPGATCLHHASTTIAKEYSSNTVSTIAQRNKLLMHYVHLTGWQFAAWMAIAAATMWYKKISGNKSYTESWQQFQQLKGSAQQSKEKFALLVASYSATMSLQKAVEKIKASLPPDYELF